MIRRNNLTRMIDAHPEQCHLHQVEMTQKEIAAKLGISQRAVQFREDRALMKLWALREDEEFKSLLMAAVKE